VLEKREVEAGSQWEYRALMVGAAGSSAFVIGPDDLADWTAASADEKAAYFYISGDDGLMSDGSKGAVIV
jgi:hypothetical protein